MLLLCTVYESAQFAKCAARFGSVVIRVSSWLGFESEFGLESGLGLGLGSSVDYNFANCLCAILKLRRICRLHRLRNCGQLWCIV